MIFPSQSSTEWDPDTFAAPINRFHVVPKTHWDHAQCSSQICDPCDSFWQIWKSPMSSLICNENLFLHHLGYTLILDPKRAPHSNLIDSIYCHHSCRRSFLKGQKCSPLWMLYLQRKQQQSFSSNLICLGEVACSNSRFNQNWWEAFLCLKRVFWYTLIQLKFSPQRLFSTIWMSLNENV